MSSDGVPFRYEQTLLLQAMLALTGPPAEDDEDAATCLRACDASTLADMARLFHEHRFGVSSSQLVFLPSTPTVAALSRKLQHLCVLVLINAMQLYLVTGPVDGDDDGGAGAGAGVEPHPVLASRDSTLTNLFSATYVEAAKQWWRSRHEAPPYAPVVQAWLALLMLAARRGMDRSGASEEQVANKKIAEMSYDDDPAGQWTAEYLRTLLREVGAAAARAFQGGPLRAATSGIVPDLSEAFGVRCDAAASVMSVQYDDDSATDLAAAGDDVNNDDGVDLADSAGGSTHALAHARVHGVPCPPPAVVLAANPWLTRFVGVIPGLAGSTMQAVTTLCGTQSTTSTAPSSPRYSSRCSWLGHWSASRAGLCCRKSRRL